MAIPIIMNAISYGYNAKNILGHIANHYPKYKKPIEAALKYGYPAHTILKKLTHPNSSDEGEEYLTEHEKTLRNYRNQKYKGVKQLGAGIAGAAALGAGLYGLTRKTPQIPVPEATAQLAPVPKPPAPLSREAIVQQAEQRSIKPELPSITPQKSPTATQVKLAPEEERIVNQFPQLNRFIDSHLAKGKTPEETYNLLKASKATNPIVKKFESIRNTPFLNVIEQRSASRPQLTDVVLTPQGAGEVRKIEGKEAIVNLNGKYKKVPVSEIEKPEADLVSAVNDILQIPEIDRSSNVALFAYDPEERKMFIQFHSGDIYRYNDVDPEEVRKVAEKEAIPVSMGQNVYGAWSPDDPRSLGAALWQYFISNPKYAKPKKGQKENPNYKRLDVKYDYWSPLRKQKKAKKPLGERQYEQEREFEEIGAF